MAIVCIYVLETAKFMWMKSSDDTFTASTKLSSQQGSTIPYELLLTKKQSHEIYKKITSRYLFDIFVNH